jgi:hypothetical protein
MVPVVEWAREGAAEAARGRVVMVVVVAAVVGVPFQC